MLRRGLFVFLFAAIIVGGFFILEINVSRADDENLDSANWSTIHDGVTSTYPTWDYTAIDQRTPNSGAYLAFKYSSSSLTSPEIDLTGCVSAKLRFNAGTFGGVATSTFLGGVVTSSIVAVSVFSNNTWQDVAEREPTSTSLKLMETIDLSLYCGQTIKLKFNSPYAIRLKGFGISNIYLAKASQNQPPIAEAGEDRNGAVNEEILFDGSASQDNDGTVVSWLWDFNGWQKTGVTTTYSFATSGNYTVYLTVIDNLGVTSTADSVNVVIVDETTSTDENSYQPGDLVVNEVLPAPSSGNNEWVELFNNTSEAISLTGWTLLNKEGSNFTTTTLSGEIAPDEFLIIEDINGNLNNSGDTVILKDSTGQIIDQIVYGDFSSCSNCAWARLSDGVDSDNDAADFAATITSTKNAPNIITAKPVSSQSSGGSVNDTIKTTEKPTTTSTSSTTSKTTAKIIKKITEIIVNEVYPNPTAGEDEFIELKNLSNQSFDVSGLIIKDASGKKFQIAANTPPVASQGLLVINRHTSSIALNNSGRETVAIYDGEQVIDQIAYVGGKKGLSFSRKDNGEWQWSNPTPGEENLFGGEEMTQVTAVKVTTKSKATAKTVKKSGAVIETDLISARELDLGSKVKVKGVVAVAPGVLGTQIFYLAGSGMQVYSYKKDFPELKVGDYVEVVGELAESGGERRIKITAASDIKFIEHQAEPIPHQISTGEVNENYEGYLVEIIGDVLEIKGRYIYLDDNGDEVKVYIKSNMAMPDVGVKTGDKVKIIGIVSQTASGYRLLPRSLSDINVIVGEVKGVSEKNTAKNFSSNYYLMALVIFLVATIGWLILQRRQKNTGN